MGQTICVNPIGATLPGGLMQVGIELSEDEGDLDPFEDDLAIRGKGGRKTGGRQTGTADAAVAAKQLQKVLQQALWLAASPAVAHPDWYISRVSYIAHTFGGDARYMCTLFVHCVYTDTSMNGRTHTVVIRGLLLSRTAQVTMV